MHHTSSEKENFLLNHYFIWFSINLFYTVTNVIHALSILNALTNMAKGRDPRPGGCVTWTIGCVIDTLKHTHTLTPTPTHTHTHTNTHHTHINTFHTLSTQVGLPQMNVFKTNLITWWIVVFIWWKFFIWHETLNSKTNSLWKMTKQFICRKMFYQYSINTKEKFTKNKDCLQQ